MLNPAIRVSESDIEGSGLFAKTFIPAGEVLYQFDDTKPPVHQHQLIYLPQEARLEFMKYACQIGDDEFCFQQGDIMYINHSCDPTGWWESSGILTARRDINPGEEIAYDYSTSDIQLNYQMECQCGNDTCRGVVTDKDYLNPEFQQRYAGHLPTHVMEAIKRANANEPDPQESDIGQVPTEVVEVVRKTISKAAEFHVTYGNGYVFEMVRQTILQLQSGGVGAQVVPESRRKYDDKTIFTLVRRLILQSLRELILKN